MTTNDTNEAYHADTSYVSASMLKDLATSPRVFEAKHVTKTLQMTPSPQMELGTAVHCAALEPHRFDSEYTFVPSDVDHRRSTTSYKDWAKTQPKGVTILKPDVADTVARCVYSLRSVPLIKKILQADGMVERSHRWDCPLTQVPCKFRPDKILESGIILDIKTISSCSEEEFRKAVINFRYHLQAAHYLCGASTTYQTDDWQFVFAVVETSEPFRCRAFSLDDEAIGLGFDQREGLLQEYKRRKESGDWSESGEKELVTVSLPEWFLRKA